MFQVGRGVLDENAGYSIDVWKMSCVTDCKVMELWKSLRRAQRRGSVRLGNDNVGWPLDSAI